MCYCGFQLVEFHYFACVMMMWILSKSILILFISIEMCSMNVFLNINNLLQAIAANFFFLNLLLNGRIKIEYHATSLFWFCSCFIQDSLV